MRSFRTLAVGAAVISVMAACVAPSKPGGKPAATVPAVIGGTTHSSGPTAAPPPPDGDVVPDGWDENSGPGRGYDLADSDYFSSAGLKTSYILDVPKLITDQRIRRQVLSDVHTQIDVGRTIRRYAQSVSADIGIGGVYGLFRGSVSVSFDVASQVSSDQAFLTNRAEVRKLEYFIEGGSRPATLMPYLTDSFRADINDSTVPPAQLFTTYGTHLPFSLGYGGRLTMNYLYTNTAQRTETELSERAQAQYILISGHASGDVKTAASDLEQNSTVVIKSTGGTNSIDVTSIAAAAASYAPWEGTINADNPASLSFIGSPAYGERIGDWALPIWDFATDPARAKVIRVAFNATLAANAAYFDTLQAPQQYIKDIYVAADPSATVAMNKLLTQIPPTSNHFEFADPQWDLNKGAGGDYIFLGYTTTIYPSEAITDIVIVDGTDPSSYRKNGVDYISTNVDLNQGASGGDFLRLFYTTNYQAAAQPGYVIRDIGIQIGAGTTPHVHDGAGWGVLSTDLNKGASGDYIYLWYQLEKP